MTDKQIIGREVAIDFVNDMSSVPAKVDTGADSSAVWASDIFVDTDNLLHFKLFDKKSKYYSGKEYVTREYTIARTKSSLGELQLKYRVKLLVVIAGKKIRATFGLSDRSTHNYPILIGRRTLSNKFLVDVSIRDDLIEIKRNTEPGLNRKMQEDPYKFYKEHYLKGAAKK